MHRPRASCIARFCGKFGRNRPTVSPFGVIHRDTFSRAVRRTVDVVESGRSRSSATRNSSMVAGRTRPKWPLPRGSRLTTRRRRRIARGMLRAALPEASLGRATRSNCDAKRCRDARLTSQSTRGFEHNRRYAPCPVAQKRDSELLSAALNQRIDAKLAVDVPASSIAEFYDVSSLLPIALPPPAARRAI